MIKLEMVNSGKKLQVSYRELSMLLRLLKEVAPRLSAETWRNAPELAIVLHRYEEALK